MKNLPRILVSSCLLGECTKYNGGHNKNKYILSNIDKYEIINVCPEELGGLPTPRPPAEINGGDGFSVLEGTARVINNIGYDVTKEFVDGAHKTLAKCIENDCKVAIFKDNSPSCGNKLIYDGSFSKNKVKGVGVTTALLINNNINVLSEEDELDELQKRD